MDFKLPAKVSELFNIFNKAGYQLYIVGGAVRDLLMGKGVNDWDFTTDATPEQILELFPDGFYDNKFGTVGVKRLLLQNSPSSYPSPLKSEGTTERHASRDSTRNQLEDTIPSPIWGEGQGEGEIFEITTMRREGDYKDFRHPVEVGWTDKIEEDLARRDFTINAMALGLEERGKEKGESEIKKTFTLHPSSFILTDPFGGQKDLAEQQIRAVGDPTKRFQEDALRLMRAVRIATQLNFYIEEKTYEALQDYAYLITEIAWERIKDELFKILASDNAYNGILLLREVGLLQITLPELEKTFGIYQEGPKHDREYDIGEHNLLTLKHTPTQDPLVKLAALLHDVGKSETYQKDETGNVTFYNHEIVGGKIVSEISKRLKLSKKQSDKLYKLVRFHMFTINENQTDSAIRRFIKNVGIENIDDMMALRVGDRLGGGTQKAVSWRMEKFRERMDQVMKKPFSVTDLKVNGQDVMAVLGIPPSKKVGEVLDILFQEVLEEAEKNDREYLLGRIKEIAR
jgi:tRNA nucleotidyltransferase (CCA-adding enzyme)